MQGTCHSGCARLKTGHQLGEKGGSETRERLGEAGSERTTLLREGAKETGTAGTKTLLGSASQYSVVPMANDTAIEDSIKSEINKFEGLKKGASHNTDWRSGDTRR